MGVGAAIAAGSQALNGDWALLEKAARKRNLRIMIGKFFEFHRSHVLGWIKIPIDKIIKISPIRFEIIVIIPDSLAL